MPRVKGLPQHKLQPQPPVTNDARPFKATRKAMSHRVTWYSGYIGASSSLAVVSERAASEIRSYRRDLIMCEKDICSCICYCHTGDQCDGPIDRVHTPGHKPQHPVVYSDPFNPCKLDNQITRHRHTVTCHDRVDQTLDPRHERRQ